MALKSSGTRSLWNEAERQPTGSTTKTSANALIHKYARPPLEQLAQPKQHRVSGFFEKTHNLTSTAAPGERLYYPSPVLTASAFTTQLGNLSYTQAHLRMRMRTKMMVPVGRISPLCPGAHSIGASVKT